MYVQLQLHMYFCQHNYTYINLYICICYKYNRPQLFLKQLFIYIDGEAPNACIGKCVRTSIYIRSFMRRDRIVLERYMRHPTCIAI